MNVEARVELVITFDDGAGADAVGRLMREAALRFGPAADIRWREPRLSISMPKGDAVEILQLAQPFAIAAAAR